MFQPELKVDSTVTRWVYLNVKIITDTRAKDIEIKFNQRKLNINKANNYTLVYETNKFN